LHERSDKVINNGNIEIITPVARFLKSFVMEILARLQDGILASSNSVRFCIDQKQE
jgi:hypothetical protein